MKRVLISAGEASSDVHAANLVRAFCNNYGHDVEFSGLGGEKLISTGNFTPEYYNREFAVSGLMELGTRIPLIYSALRHFKRMASFGAYNAAVLLDYPDFNMPLAKHLMKCGIPVIYYISPQVWVWRKSRAEKLKAISSEILTIFPFEKDFYAGRGIDVKYVGHPLIDEFDTYKKRADIASIRDEFKISKEQKVIAVLPGSRHGEIKYILPIIEKVCSIVKENYNGDLKFLMPVAPTLKKDDICFTHPSSKNLIQIIDGARSYDVYSVSDYAVLASGTATVEAALFGVPMSVVYKVSPVSAFLFHYFVRYKDPIGMVNLLLGKDTVKEFFQEKADPELVAGDVLSYLNDEDTRLKKSNELKKIHELLYTGNSASSNVAQILSKYL